MLVPERTAGKMSKQNLDFEPNFRYNVRIIFKYWCLRRKLYKGLLKKWLIWKYQTLPNIVIYTLVQVAPQPLYSLYMDIFKTLFDDNVSNRKTFTYFKGYFKTPSKSRNIKLLVNWRYNISQTHLPVNH